jgi:hypothetical protein
MEDRLTILKVVINIFRILITLKEFTPVNTTYELYRTIHRENDVEEWLQKVEGTS